MRFYQFNEAIRFSPSDYPSLLDDPDMIVGYEIEFIAPASEPRADSMALKGQHLRYAKEHILNQLKHDLGLDVGYNLLGRQILAKWNLVKDTSIKPQDPNLELGWELVSPPMQIQLALDNLQKIFRWMETNHCYTNGSTGFHVNVSYKNKRTTKKADPLKLVLLLGEKYVADLFDRYLNTYAKPHLPDLQAKIAQNPNLASSDLEVQQIKKNIRSLLDPNKYKSVNLGKQAEKGYFEFRIPGNKEYHKRFEQVKNTILRFAFVLKASLDKTAFQREYNKEIAKLILSAKSQLQGDLEGVIPSGLLAHLSIAARDTDMALSDLYYIQTLVDEGSKTEAMEQIMEFLHRLSRWIRSHPQQYSQQRIDLLSNVVGALLKKWNITPQELLKFGPSNILLDKLVKTKEQQG